MKKLPSCFRRGLGVVNNDRQFPLAPFPGQRPLGLYDCMVGDLRIRRWHVLAMSSGKDLMQVRQNGSRRR
jgi:hypothetical protein